MPPYIEMKAIKDYLAVFASVAACVVVFWRGGEMSNCLTTAVANLHTLTLRVETLESGATRGAEKHIDKDDQRDAAAALAISDTQKQVASLLEMKAQVAAMSAQSKGQFDLLNLKIDNLSENVKKHIEDKRP